MLYSLFLNLIDTYSFLNVFKYLTVRTGLAMFTSMLVVFLVGKPFINFFSARQIHDPIRSDGPEDHIIKKIGTPTMGGLLILLGLFSGILLWGDLSSPYIWFLMFIVGSFGFIGAYDDYKKMALNESEREDGIQALGIMTPSGDHLKIAKEWQQKKYDAGWAMLHWPKEYGGGGLTYEENHEPK